MSGDPVCPDVAGRDLCGGGALPLPDVRGRGPEPGDRSVPEMRADPHTRPVGTLSDRALALIDGPRQDAYAAPEVNLGRIGVMWSAILGLAEPIEAHRVALMMAALKIARAAHRPDDDSLVDAVGYLELVERLR